MNSRPSVSVLIPLYNHEQYIETAVRSVLSQTFTDLELIVINDGSTDSSDRVIRELLKSNTFFYKSRENLGVVKTCNELVRSSRGKYFVLMASDDFLEPTFLKKQLESLERNPEALMSFTNTNFVDENNKILRTKHQPGFYLEEDVFAQFLKGNFITANSVMFRKERFMNYGMYDEKELYEDYPFWIKVLWNGEKIIYVDEILANYRLHSNNLHKDLYQRYLVQSSTLNKYIDDYRVKAVLQEKYVLWFSYLAKDNKKESLKYLVKSFKRPYSRHFIIGLGRLFYINKLINFLFK